MKPPKGSITADTYTMLVAAAMSLITPAFGSGCGSNDTKAANMDADDAAGADCALVDGFLDDDQDGFGTGAAATVCADAFDLLHMAAVAGDCDDTRSAVYPGAIEDCDGQDNDCDGLVDDEDPDLVLDGRDIRTTWRDSDGDNFGDPDTPLRYCQQLPAGTSNEPTDCDDTLAAVYPRAFEICNGIDDDCDGLIDDADNSLTGAEREHAYPDEDDDGFGVSDGAIYVCTLPAGYVGNLDGGEDCDDRNASIYPGAPEACDHQDADCDGIIGRNDPDVDPSVQTLWYFDADNDGYAGAAVVVADCTRPSFSYHSTADDCDDADRDVNPGEDEVCNGQDDNCDGLVDDDDPALVTQYIGISAWPDADGDGYGDSLGTQIDFCVVPDGYAALNDDCDDSSSSARPSAEEVCDNGIDDNCDGLVDDCTQPNWHILHWSGSTPNKPLEGVHESRLGRYYLSSGDVNGDGLTDILAMSEIGRDETAHVLNGSISWETDWSSPSFTLTDAPSWGGVYIVGDFDGDGYDDIALGEEGTAATTDFTIIPGSPTLAGSTTSTALLTSGDAWLFTDSTSSRGIWAAGPAGDLNTDGYDDLWIYGADTSTSAKGVWLLMGTTSVSGLQTDYFDHAAAYLEEPNYKCANYNDGDELSFGDLDGDGHSDAVWGCEWDDRDGTNVGQVYAWMDVVGEGASAHGLPLSYDLRVGTRSPSVINYLGDLAQVVGDVDNDGYDDLFLGSSMVYSPTPVSAGGWLFYGSSGIAGQVDVEDADVVISSASYFAYEYNPARGDVNDDGIDDLIVNALGYDSTTFNIGVAGAVVMFEGGSRLTGTIDVATDGDWRVYGEWETYSMPYRVAVGDVDGSGAPDIVFASPYHQASWIEDGALFILPDFAQ